MLLKKIHHLKTKIKSHISNIDLLDIVVEDNNSIREELEELKSKLEDKSKEIEILKKRSATLEKLNISYSKDVLLLSKAVAEQYEVLATLVNKEYLIFPDDIFDSEFDHKKKKKKIVH